MRKSLLHAVLLGVLVAGCGAGAPAPRAEPETITVFAAASLTDAFEEIGSALEASDAGIQMRFSFAGSQTLRTQIETGAPADVFASANQQEMDALVASGIVAADSPRVFLTNELVVILPAANPGSMEKLQDLSRPGVKLVLAAEEVPVGAYARQALGKMNQRFGGDFGVRALANIVSNEDNVRQVVAKVQLGEADAGIVYLSDAVAASDLRTLEIPPELNVVAEYPIAVLATTRHALLAQRFVDYVLSPTGQAALREWGFKTTG